MRFFGLLAAFLVLTVAVIAASAPYHGAADGVWFDMAEAQSHSPHVGNCDDHGGPGGSETDGHCSLAGGLALLSPATGLTLPRGAGPAVGYRDNAHADADGEGLKRPPRLG